MPWILVPLVLVGGAETAWGVGVLAARGVPLPRLALAGSVSLAALLVVLLLVPAGLHHHGGAGGGGLPLGALAGAGGLDLATAVLLALRVRRGSRAGEPRPATFLIGTGLAAAAVAALTVVSLAGTAVGAHHVH